MTGTPARRVTLVTGATGGIGRALCRRFAAAGDAVIVSDRDAGAVAALCAELGEAGTTAVAAAVADVTNAAALAGAIDSATAAIGPVDVLVANAGGASAGSIATTTEASWRRDLDLNLTGAMHSVEAVRAAMAARGKGAIVFIGSVNGLAMLGHPAYSAAKAGLISYARALAVEFGPKGLRANVVCPGTVRTPAWAERVARDPEVLDRLVKWYPLGRVAEPEDIAAACLFLASDDARMITGAVLPVDGGLMAGNRVMAAELTLESF